MNNLLLRWSVRAFVVGTLTVLSAGCVLSDGGYGYGYDDGGAMARVTTNPTVSNMVAGDPATMWRRIAAVTIVHPVEAATHLRMLIDPRLLPARCRLFRRMAAAVMEVVAAVMVVALVMAAVERH